MSVAQCQVDLLAIEEVAGTLNDSTPGCLFTRKRDQGLSVALTTKVVQDENTIWLQLWACP